MSMITKQEPINSKENLAQASSNQNPKLWFLGEPVPTLSWEDWKSSVNNMFKLTEDKSRKISSIYGNQLQSSGFQLSKKHQGIASLFEQSKQTEQLKSQEN